jgi:RNA-directed DNA polymerase
MPVELVLQSLSELSGPSRRPESATVYRQVGPASDEACRLDEPNPAHPAPAPRRHGAYERWLLGRDIRRGGGGGQSVEWFFDTIPHAPLLAKMGRRIADGRVLELVQQFLKQDIMEDMTRWTPISGSPQGAVISPLIANIYLHELDVEMREAGLVMVRYADDTVVLCRSREEAESALARLRTWVNANGLMLHPDKTHVRDCRMEGQGFEFLGYRFEAGQRLVRKKSLKSVRDKIRAKTKRNEGHSIEYVIASLNPTLRGWFAYFQHAHHFTFSSLDGFIRRRLRAMLRRQKHRPGQGQCRRDHTQWPNAFFADLGLFTMSEAHRLARQSR